MKNFNGERGGERREGGYKGKPSFQKKAWESKDKVMYKATCSECGKSCEVPFRPDGSKPVFCNDCFNKKRDPSDTRGARPSFNDRFAPRSDAPRPSYTDRPAFKAAPDNTGKQLSEISMKLDRLIATMEKLTTPKAAPAPAVKAEKTAPAKTAKVTKKAAPKVGKKVVKKKK